MGFVRLLYSCAIMSFVFAFMKRYEAYQDWLLIGGFGGLVFALVVQIIVEMPIVFVGYLALNFTKIVIFLIAAGLAAYQVFFVWH